MNEADLKRIATEVFDTPMLAHPAKLNNFLSVFGPRILSGMDFSAFANSERVDHRVMGHALDYLAAIEAEQVSYPEEGDYVIADGVAIVPLIGSLVHRGWRMNSSGMTAYQAFDRNMAMAHNDGSAHSILLDVDTPGGQVAGCFDLADTLMQQRGNKKTVAVANDLSASAGYLIGCCADEVVVAQTGVVGSIGVVMAHIDRSKEMEELGRAVTFIYAGDHKVDGHAFGPLPDTVKASLQADVDTIYRMFTSHVAKARGMAEKKVIDTQAAMFLGKKAVEAGLADRVGTLKTEFQRLRQSSAPRGAGSRRFATR